MVPHLHNFCYVYLNRTLTIFEDYETKVIPKLTFLLGDLQNMHMSVTVGSLAHEDVVLDAI